MESSMQLLNEQPLLTFHFQAECRTNKNGPCLKIRLRRLSKVGRSFRAKVKSRVLSGKGEYEG